MAQVFQIVVEVDDGESRNDSMRGNCSPAPSTSSSSDSSPSGTPQSSRQMSKKKSTSSWHYLGECRKTKRISASKIKYSKRLRTASKMRLWKSKIDKEHEKKLAVQLESIERIKRERELLRAGTSPLAIMCDALTENARSLRRLYERKQAVLYQALIPNRNEAEDGFYSQIFY